MKYLSVGTYPRHPATQGGRLRVDAIHRILREQGWETLHLWVGSPDSGALSIWDQSAAERDQIGIMFSGAFERFLRQGKGRPDVRAFEFLRDDHFARQRFQDAILAFDPDVIAVEQAMLWPSISAYFKEISSRRAVTLVYSSHNVEHRLLGEEAALPNVRGGTRDIALMMAAEMALTAEADLVVAASKDDRDYFASYAHNIVLAANGCWPRKTRPGGKGALFVSSAHPHNVQGFIDYLGETLVELPPGETIAVIGGACDLLRERCAAAVRAGRLSLRGRVDESVLGEALDAHAIILLPIGGGGGTNLKTAEALATGKVVLATPQAMRGFETHFDPSRIHVEATPEAYMRRLRELLRHPPVAHGPPVDRADISSLSWNRSLADLPALLAAPNRYGWKPAIGKAARLWITADDGWIADGQGRMCMSGRTASLTLTLGEPATPPGKMEIALSVLADFDHPVGLEMSVAEGRASEVRLEWPHAITKMEIDLPIDARELHLTFCCDAIWSPADLGLSRDGDARGVTLHHIRMTG